MSEYIKRERVLEILHDIGGCGAEPGTWDDGYDSAINAAYDAVQSEPANDVAPVIHSKWVYGEFDIPHCSECGHEVMPNVISPFCPNCGAKMDGTPCE